MRFRLIAPAFAAVFAMACGAAQHQQQRQRMTAKEIVEATKPAIVRIESDFGDGPGGEERVAVATGFVIDAGGLIATNLHVIRGARDIQVTFLDGSTHSVARIAAVDPERDLAVISVDAEDLPVLELGDSDAVSAGDHVVAIGNPLGVLDYTVSDGLISSVRPVTENLTVLQITAPISEGSSGGPLFNIYGEVIGVTTMFASEGQNLNFGVPSQYLRDLLARPGEGYTVEEFASEFGPVQPSPPTARTPEGAEDVQIQRRVPRHEVSILDGCSDEALVSVYRGIGEAIEIGAPLYNDGNHEACYRIYEGTALRYERDLECAGIREALGQGLLRASTQATFTEKAWAMRDAFDGIMDVITRRARES